MLSWRAVAASFTLVLLLLVALLELSSHQSGRFYGQFSDPKDIEVEDEIFKIGRFAKDVLPDWRQQAQYDRGLVKRDVCNDTFPGRYSQTCSPSNTLCCIIPGEDLPACQQILGYGFCCTEHVDCFVDMASQCGKTGSVKCDLGTNACCPQYTTCYPGFNGSSSLVRCNINQNLNPHATSSSTSSRATTTSTSTITSRTTITTSTSTTSRASTTSTTGSASSSPSSSSSSSNSTASSQNSDKDASSNSSGLSGGTIAGIVIGALASLAIGIAMGYFVFRRKNQRKVVPSPVNTQGQYMDQPYGSGGLPSPYAGSQTGYGGQYIPASYHEAANKPHMGRPGPPQELPASRPISELPS